MKTDVKQALFEYNRRKCRESFLAFIKAIMPSYNFTWFHIRYALELEKFAKGDIKKLTINIPPQHGKSLLSTVLLPCWMLGLNPDDQIAIASYNQGLASRFGRMITRIIESPVYREIFPDVTLSNGADGYQKNSDEIEIVNFNGCVRLVGVGSGLTGRPIDKLILDDLYKDASEAWSPVVQDSVWDWYLSVAQTRLHNDSQELQVYTRWSPKDVIGRLLDESNHNWRILKYPAIKIGEPTQDDPRNDGEALFPDRHSIDKLQEARIRDPHSFECLFQQDPKPREGLLYRQFETYQSVPSNAIRKAYIDTADTGKDFLCSVCYAQTKDLIYVLDVVYTQDPMEITEPKVANQLMHSQVTDAVVESNNGGRGFARNVEVISRKIGNYKTTITWEAQRQNKEARILTNSSTVNNLIRFPEHWERLWPIFHADLTMFSAKSGNKHDDAPDTLTAIVERFETKNSKSNSAALKAFR